MKKRIVALMLAIIIIATSLPLAVFANAEGEEITSVSNSEELQKALENNASNIKVTADITVDRTFYVSSKTTIYSEEKHTLTRDENFSDDIFVVGEDSKGRNMTLDNVEVELNLGKPNSSEEEMLVIDGNKDNMKVDVTGTVIFICYSADVNFYSGVTIKNCKKVGNKKALQEAYHLPYKNRIGGATVINSNGAFNMYGGKITDNDVNDELIVTDDNDFENERDSSLGGAIFNFSTVKMYGGILQNNHAARGGAIYNYRIVKLYNCEFRENTAMKYGGAIYQAESQYGEIIMGDELNNTNYSSIFNSNSSGNSGGAIFTQTKNALLIYKNANAIFEGNKATSYNGGAICSSSSLIIKKATFKENNANLKGGALYISNSDDKLVTRLPKIENADFISNTAQRGGAVGIMAKDKSYSEGGIAEFEKCKFTQNKATSDEQSENKIDKDDSDTDKNGGAIYASRKSKLVAKKCTFSENSSDDEGGSVYVTSESKADINECTFNSNTAKSEENGNGGAIATHGSTVKITSSKFNENKSAKHAGAIYISYNNINEEEAIPSNVVIEDSKFTSNSSNFHGGAIYTTSKEDSESEDSYLKVTGSVFSKNTAAKNGGAIYFTKSKSYLHDNDFNDNTAFSTDYGGGAIYSTQSEVTVNSARFKNNSSKKNGGAIAQYSQSKVVLNRISAEQNEAVEYGGASYVHNSELTVYNSEFKSNSCEGNAGAISCNTDAKVKVYSSNFDSNTTKGNGGAVYVYTGEEGNTLIQDSTFKNNTANETTKSYGGAIYASKVSKLDLMDNEAIGNTSAQGGFLYITTGGTTANINGLTVSGNNPQVVCGNAKSSILNLHKETYVDRDTEVNEEYWTNFETQANSPKKLTINYKNMESPSYSPYKYTEQTPTNKEEKIVPVDEIFDIAKNSSDESINSTYDGLPKLDDKNNFMSIGTTTFDNINDSQVTVDSFVYKSNKPQNNTNVGQGILIYQAMLYKKAHPDKEVSIDISSFHFSVEAAVCINRNSRYFGYMRNIAETEYDKYGFVRISYLLVSAAKMGIHVNVVAQLDGYPMDEGVPSVNEYFNNHLLDRCDPTYEKNKYVSNFLNFNMCEWTSYGNDAATDMMHTKACVVSNYIDKNGEEHGNAIWLGSSNIDGINPNGTNGNDGLQTAVIVSDHEKLYQVTHNYVQLISKYCGQEDVYEFRDLVGNTMKKQIELIRNGKENTIDKNEQIVYIGEETDDVFELYFAPFGGNAAKWDEINNPFCKYLRELSNSDDYIWFVWNNVKFFKSFPLCSTMESVISEAFHKNKNRLNRIYINLLGNGSNIPGYNTDLFNDLKLGEDIQYKSLNQRDLGAIHSKDIQMSYSKNKKRYYVSLLNSMNIHQGSMSYQSNYALIIKETNNNKDSVFYKIADNTTKGILNDTLTDKSLNISETQYTYDGSVKKPTVTVEGVNPNDYDVVYSGDCINPGIYTVTVKEKGDYFTGSKSCDFTILPEKVKDINASAKDNSIELSWTKSGDVSGYDIYQLINNEWVKIRTTTETSATITDLNPATTYSFKVKAYKNDRSQTIYGEDSNELTVSTTYTEISNVTQVNKTPDKVKNLKASAENTSVKLTWKKVNDVKGYEIYQLKNKKWVKIKTTSGTSYTVSKLKSATSYSFKVKAYTKNGSKTVYGKYSSVLKVTTTKYPGKVNFKLKAGKKKVQVKWNKVKDAKGYKVYYSTSAKGKFKLLKATKLNSYTLKDLKSNKKYYFRVKAYSKVGKKTYNGKYNTKNIKTK